MYKHHRTNHSRLLNREFLQKISLCFLIGFLCGAVFYYCFQNSFREILQATLENNTKTWTKETAPQNVKDFPLSYPIRDKGL